MSSLPRHLARGLDVRTDVTARAARDDRGRWTVEDVTGARWEADAVILTAPAPQSLALLDAGGVGLAEAARRSLEGVRYHRCLAGMFDAPWPDALPAHGVAPAEDPLSWLACNRRKGASAVDALTAHASPAWASNRKTGASKQRRDTRSPCVTRPGARIQHACYRRAGAADTRLARERMFAPRRRRALPHAAVSRRDREALPPSPSLPPPRLPITQSRRWM